MKPSGHAEKVAGRDHHDAHKHRAGGLDGPLASDQEIEPNVDVLPNLVGPEELSDLILQRTRIRGEVIGGQMGGLGQAPQMRLQPEEVNGFPASVPVPLDHLEQGRSVADGR